MTNPFQNAITAGLAAIRGFAGSPATYSRGGQVIKLQSVVRGQRRVETTSASPMGGGSSVTTRGDDFLISTAELNLEPKPGDQITVTANGTRSTFEVMSPISGSPCWRYCDASRSTIRVHTKLIREVAA